MPSRTIVPSRPFPRIISNRNISSPTTLNSPSPPPPPCPQLPLSSTKFNTELFSLLPSLLHTPLPIHQRVQCISWSTLATLLTWTRSCLATCLCWSVRQCVEREKNIKSFGGRDLMNSKMKFGTATDLLSLPRTGTTSPHLI